MHQCILARTHAHAHNHSHTHIHWNIDISVRKYVLCSLQTHTNKHIFIHIHMYMYYKHTMTHTRVCLYLCTLLLSFTNNKTRRTYIHSKNTFDSSCVFENSHSCLSYTQTQFYTHTHTQSPSFISLYYRKTYGFTSFLTFIKNVILWMYHSVKWYVLVKVHRHSKYAHEVCKYMCVYAFACTCVCTRLRVHVYTHNCLYQYMWYPLSHSLSHIIEIFIKKYEHVSV